MAGERLILKSRKAVSLCVKYYGDSAFNSYMRVLQLWSEPLA